MAVVRPFRGWRYDLSRAGSAEDLLSPPYDIITPELASRLRSRSPSNAIHVELPEGTECPEQADSRYVRAARLFSSWKRDAVVTPEPVPALYLYEQDFTLPDGTRHRRLGFLGALQLEPYEAGVVLPHEQTFPKHKEDRFQLLSAARAQFSPIMGLYSDTETDYSGIWGEQTRTAPDLTSVDHEGVMHRLWRTTDMGLIAALQSVLRDRLVFIADGHHRYETALRFQAAQDQMSEQRNQWFDSMLVYLVAMEDPGLALMPTHRLVRGLRSELLPNAGQRFVADFEVSHVDQPGRRVPPGSIRLILPGGIEVCDLQLRGPSPVKRSVPEASDALASLEAAILHRHILPKLLGADTDAEVVYTRDAEEVRRRVASGEFQMGFILPAPRVEKMRAISLSGERMPEKTTYFWPKAWAGLVFYGEGSL